MSHTPRRVHLRDAARALGEALHESRQLRCLSQERVAHLAGISVETYIALERGFSPQGKVANPTLNTVVKVLTALDIAMLIQQSDPERSSTSGAAQQIALMISIVAAMGLAAPAIAAELSEDSTLDALEYVTSLDESAATAILSDIAAVGATAPEFAVDATVAGNEITVPVDATNPLTYNGIGIELPFSDQADEATSDIPGIITFANNNNTTSSAVVKKDGTIQLLTVINNAAAPVKYEYAFDIPSSATIDLLADGGVLISGEDGSLLLGVAAPWAIDANGAHVATHYEFSGNILTQIVDHQNQSVSYPIVADPWLGSDIFQYVSSNSSTQKVVAVVSGWGSAIHTGVAQGGGLGAWAAGQAILKGAGWDELRTKAPLANNKRLTASSTTATYSAPTRPGRADRAGTWKEPVRTTPTG